MFARRSLAAPVAALTLGVILLARWLPAEAAPEPPLQGIVSKEKDPPKPGEVARKARRALVQYVSVDAIKPNTPFKDAVETLSERFRIPIEIDNRAFEAIGVQKADEQPVELPKMTNVRLGTVLKRLAAQVKGDQYTGAYLVRPTGVSMTTTYHQWLEGGADPMMYGGGSADPNNNQPGAGLGVDDDQPIVARELGYFGTYRRMTAVVHLEYERLPLVDALRDLADDTGYDILIDPRIADKARAPITLGLNAVWLDNAINLMTESADLDWYWMDKVAFVTSKEHAKARRERLKAAQRPRNEAPLEVRARTVSIDCTDQPLTDVVRGLGLQIVIDQRVAEKAAAKLTLKFDNVPPETALRLLADMADLAVVPLDRVFYITSKDNARNLAAAAKDK